MTMKKQFILLAAFVNWALLSQAATLTVNNLSPSPGQYATVALAMTAAANGDIILIQPSTISYGAVTVNKSVTLRGGGWNPVYKQTVNVTTLDDITLSAALNDVKIEGINFSSLSLGFNSTTSIYGQSNVKIEFCTIRSTVAFYRGCHDWLIRNNYFANINGNCLAASGIVSNNLIVEYNVFAGYLTDFSLVSNVLIDHNLFISTSTSSTRFAMAGTTNGLLVSNNIFSNVQPVQSGVVITNSTFTNNIYTKFTGSVVLPTGSGVTVSEIPNPTNKVLEFETYDNTGFNVNHNYRLKSTSLGKGAGSDGKDVGIQTDVNTFSMTGEPDIPAVRTMLILNSVVPSGSAININMSASKARRDKN
jgi:hypothetical protein